MRVIQYSGGIGSWATAQRVAARHGTADMVLLFANTLVEEPSLYSFLEESAAQLDVPLVIVTGVRAGSSAATAAP
jgi:3'-phosphoadenosine 5'-phosphosulfate sulfotransferase (PAPS reductase)/FAD synthetase